MIANSSRRAFALAIRRRPGTAQQQHQPQQLMVMMRNMSSEGGTTVPASALAGTDAQINAEALDQIRSRVARQKEIMSHHHGIEEEVGEMWQWVRITWYVAVPVMALSLAYSAIFDEHHHRIEGELPEYMKIRSKEFPWECSDCDLFDGKCWKECREEKKGN